MKLKSFVMIMSCTLTIQIFANTGTETSGGGNSINGEVIENYASMNIEKDLKDFKEAKEELLEKIQTIIPEFANQLKKNIEERAWYLLPVSLKQLDTKLTGLEFETDQAAYQNFDEVFISLPTIKKWTSEQRKKLFKHEILMTACEIKEIRGHAMVRKIMNTLRKENIDVAALVKDLQYNQFGYYKTADEERRLLGHQAHLEKIVKECSSTYKGELDILQNRLEIYINERRENGIYLSSKYMIELISIEEKIISLKFSKNTSIPCKK